MQARALLELECAANAEAAAGAVSPRSKAKAPKDKKPDAAPWGAPVTAVRDDEVRARVRAGRRGGAAAARLCNVLVCSGQLLPAAAPGVCGVRRAHTPVLAQAVSLSAPHEKVVVLALEKPAGDALAELRSRVGPATPAEWRSVAGGCWAAAFTCVCGPGFAFAHGRLYWRVHSRMGRRRYAAAEGEAPYRVLHVAVSRAHAERFWSLLDEYDMGYRALTEVTKVARVEKSHWVDPEQLMAFVFPSTQLHSASTGRLIVFAQYGPFNDAGKFTSGIRGLHEVTDGEVKVRLRAPRLR